MKKGIRVLGKDEAAAAMDLTVGDGSPVERLQFNGLEGHGGFVPPPSAASDAPCNRLILRKCGSFSAAAVAAATVFVACVAMITVLVLLADWCAARQDWTAHHCQFGYSCINGYMQFHQGRR